MKLSYAETRVLLRLIEKELSYLEDNLYRHKLSGDAYGEAAKHEEEIEQLKSIRRELER